MKAAINGARRASQLWQEHSASKLIERDWIRNDVNPCVFVHSELNFQPEQHGDVFLGSGPRESALVVRDMLDELFLVKKTEIISLHDDDAKEGWFLKRGISVDADGWHLELDKRYPEDLVSRLGLNDCKSAVTPGSKEASKNIKDKALGQKAHREYRGGSGVAQYMAEHRVDAAYATKELMRDAAAPTDQSWARLKRVGRYIKARPRCIIDFPWVESVGTPASHVILEVPVDSDWAEDKKERKSTSGGMIFSNGHLLKHWSSTQPTQSLSSGEAETKAITKGAIEALYLKHLLEQQGFEVEIVIHTDASAALGAANRLGAGKRMKHIEIQDLWIQQLIRNKIVRVVKINTTEIPADIVTEHVGRAWLDKVCKMCNLRFPDEEQQLGVGSSAPVDELEEEFEQEPELESWTSEFQRAAERLQAWSERG